MLSNVAPVTVMLRFDDQDFGPRTEEYDPDTNVWTVWFRKDGDPPGRARLRPARSPNACNRATGKAHRVEKEPGFARFTDKVYFAFWAKYFSQDGSTPIWSSALESAWPSATVYVRPSTDVILLTST